MMYIHEMADKVEFYPNISIYCATLEGDYIIKRNDFDDNIARQSFSFYCPELYFRIATKHETISASLFAPITIKEFRECVSFDDIDKYLVGVKKLHFNKHTRILRLHYCNSIIPISGTTKDKLYVFGDSEIKFNQTLSDFVLKNQEKWLECNPIRISDYVIIDTLINLAVNQDIKEAR